MNIKICAMAAVAAALLATGANAADDGATRISCTQNGNVIFRQDLPGTLPPEARLAISKSYSGALCMFLRIGAVDPVPASPPEALAMLSGTPETVEPSDLATALSYLSTEGQPGQPYGEAFDDGMKDFMKSGNAYIAPEPEKTVSLTIGVFKGMGTSEVLAYWNSIKGRSSVLGSMTPSVEAAGDASVLSVDGVPDSKAAAACEEAEKLASGCLAVR